MENRLFWSIFSRFLAIGLRRLKIGQNRRFLEIENPRFLAGIGGHRHNSSQNRGVDFDEKSSFLAILALG